MQNEIARESRESIRQFMLAQWRKHQEAADAIARDYEKMFGETPTGEKLAKKRAGFYVLEFLQARGGQAKQEEIEKEVSTRYGFSVHKIRLSFSKLIAAHKITTHNDGSGAVITLPRRKR